MSLEKTYAVSLDPTKVKELKKAWGNPLEEDGSFLGSLFDFLYRHYVEEQDELMPRKAHQRILVDLQKELSRIKWEYAEKLSVKQEMESKKLLCPECKKRPKWDGLKEEFFCPKCGWRGSENDAIAED